MRTLLRGFFYITIAAVLATGCTVTEQPAEEAVEVSDITAEAWQWADSVARHLPIEHQAAQLVMPAVFSKSDPYTLALITKYADMNVGGLVLLKGDVKAVTEIVDSLRNKAMRDTLMQPMFISMDAETGLNMRLKDAPAFPWNSRVREDVGEQTFFDYGREVGRESELLGINMILGPVVDVEPAIGGRGVMHMRSLGYDKERVSTLGLAYARGIESAGVISVAKHFPGHGPTSVDTHKGLAYVKKGKEELELVDLYPFKTLSNNGVSAIMVGHIWAQALDSIRRPASFSPIVIKDVLKKRLGFDGLVIVDALGMGGASGYTSADAIAAGADIILAPLDTPKEINHILEAIKDGKLTKKELFDRCRRILFYKYVFNLYSGQRSGHGHSVEELIRDMDAGASLIEPLLK